MTKICNKCEQNKEIEEFEFRKDTQKYREICRRCHLGPINETSPAFIFKKNKQEIVRLYTKERKTLDEISKLFNINRYMLNWHLRKLVKIERHREIKRLTNQDYFEKIDTEEKAYFLGLLAADGCNSEEKNRIYLGLQMQDKYMVKNFAKALGKENLSYKKPRKFFAKKMKRFINSSGCVFFQIQDKKLSNDLANLGIVSRKSLILKFPTGKQVPDHLIRHFIRGYFDGDGCVSRRFNHGACRWTIKFLSSKEFCDNFCYKIKSILNMDNISSKQDKNSKIYGVEFGGNRKVKIFLDWMYKDATIFLNRKYNKYNELIVDLERINNRLNSTYSKHNNISFDKSRNKWTAVCRINKRVISLGRFETEQEAINAQSNYYLLNKK